MQVLIAVIDDLFQFVYKAFSGAVPYKVSDEKTINTYQQTLQKIQNSTPEPVVASRVIDHATLTGNNVEVLRVGDQYFIGVIGAYLYNDPILAFDNALVRLDYGQQVRLVSLQGRWAHIRCADVDGWIFKDGLVVQSNDVYPRFTPEVQYDAHHEQTIKLRACIDDVFGGARGEHALSPAEFVQHRLQQKKRNITWGTIRMRIPGTWQRKLRGQLGIHIGISPKTESVMEYVVDGIGHLAFVEAVFPDGSIKITEIGKHDDSSYTEETLQPEQWREQRPVFIEVE